MPLAPKGGLTFEEFNLMEIKINSGLLIILKLLFRT